jgi:hypothetical protein
VANGNARLAEEIEKEKSLATDQAQGKDSNEPTALQEGKDAKRTL